MNNMQEYKEHEIKVLDVNIEEISKKLEQLGAKKVYDDVRTIIALDTKDKYYLNEKDKLIRVTDEGSIKVTMHVNQSKPEIKKGIKFKTSRLKETIDFFHEMGLYEISKVDAPRVSYELGKIDFDIDEFPMIPPFLEIDLEYIEEEGFSLEELLNKLNLSSNKIVVMGTEDIHKLYGIDYFEAYSPGLKSLKFRKNLSDLILKGEKTTTWRIFDDKNIQVGDRMQFLVWEDKSVFANAIITNVVEKSMKDLNEEDLEGHEKFNSNQEMYETYTKYYNQEVNGDTIIKIIKFELI